MDSKQPKQMEGEGKEEEFKNLLKNFFSENERVKELKKKLDERGFQKKIHTKLLELRKHTLASKYETLKDAYLEMERQYSEGQEKWNKIRPALKKLVEELKSARVEIDSLKNLTSAPSQITLEVKLLEKEKQILILTKENEGLKEKLTYLQQHLQRIEAKFLEKDHQMQQQHTLLMDKLNQAQNNYEQLLVEKEQLLERAYFRMREMSSKSSLAIEKLAFFSQPKLRHSQKPELDKDLRKAHLHLAKKVKETIILRDIVKKQKEQLAKLQKQQEGCEHL